MQRTAIGIGQQVFPGFNVKAGGGVQHRAENARKCSMTENRFAGFNEKSDRERQGQKETLRRSVWGRLNSTHPIAYLFMAGEEVLAGNVIRIPGGTGACQKIREQRRNQENDS